MFHKPYQGDAPPLPSPAPTPLAAMRISSLAALVHPESTASVAAAVAAATAASGSGAEELFPRAVGSDVAAVSMLAPSPHAGGFEMHVEAGASSSDEDAAARSGWGYGPGVDDGGARPRPSPRSSVPDLDEALLESIFSD
jgi:hypothetical protein